MLAALTPLHAQLTRGAQTSREEDFLRSYGAELAAAHAHCERYRLGGGARAELHHAWEIYSSVFGRLAKHISRMTSLELAQASPRLLQARDLELAVPGTYEPGVPVVTIGSFARSMTVIGSKQRPRKLPRIGAREICRVVFSFEEHEHACLRGVLRESAWRVKHQHCRKEDT